MSIKITEEEFEKKYEKYSQMIFNIAYTYFKNYDDSCDIMQDVFYKYLHKHNFNSEEHEYYWLIKVTVNKCNTEYVKRKRIIKITPEEMNNVKDDKRNNYRELLECIFKLDDIYKVVIVLYYYNNLSISEIAKILRKTESCIKMRLQRAKELLKIEEDKNV